MMNATATTRNENCKQDVTAITDLPICLLTDILLRLPVEDVGRCRCVHKHWNYLTREPQFTYLHLTRSSERTQDGHTFLLHPDFETSYGYPVKSLHLISNVNDHPKVSEIPSLGNGKLIGSCNGLLCVATGSFPYPPNLVYNPVSEYCITLPKVMPRPFKHQAFKCGFGFDQTRKKYRVAVTYNRKQDSCPRGAILTLGDRSWRNLQMPDEVDSHMNFRDPLFFNGAFYWVIANWDDSTRRINFHGLVTLDLGTEKFNHTKFSPSLSLDLTANFDVKQLGNAVAIVANNHWSGSLRIWKILGTNKDGSCHYEYMAFNMHFRTPISKLLFALGKNRFLVKERLIESHPEKKAILYKQRDHLVIYDLSKDEKDADYVTEVTGLPELFTPIIFTPSLISPIM